MRPAPRRIGRFDIQEQLGAGAMGVVYKARDTRLDRVVALKVLVESLVSDPEALRRFEQEARAASSLNHPNIVTVFDAGLEGSTAYIVTELLTGATLGERIDRRALPADAALDIAVQIAAGLGAAHAAGIVHRDIKPQNIFVTRAGVVKLLDFGVSRLLRSDDHAAGDATTMSDAGTRVGAIIGTPAYMAPEQIRSQAVDARADLFAFGCVLHEMLTGASPFARTSVPDVMAAVLSDAPPPLADERVPPVLGRIVGRCLAKDPADRFQTAADLQFALETARGASAVPRGAGLRSRAIPSGRALAGLLALAVAVGAGTVLPRPWAGASETGPVAEYAATVVPTSARPIAPAISPDGKWVAYISLAEDVPSLHVQFLNGGPAVRLTQDADFPLQNRTAVGGIDILPDGSGIAVAGRPRPVGMWQVPGVWIVPAPLGGPPRKLGERYASVRWSPDGRRIAAIIANPLVGDAVAVADADGQGERILVPASGGVHFHQVAWGHDGRHVYYTRTLEPNHTLGEIDRVAVAGGTPEPVVQTQGTAMFPTLTPDGRALIYAGDHRGEGLNIWWRPLDGSPERRLTTGAGEFTEPFISRDGRHLVLLARRRRGGLVRVRADGAGPAALSPIAAAGESDSDPSVEPGSDRIFFTSARIGRRQIWSIAPGGVGLAPLTPGDFDDRRPAVSDDGRHVAFVSNRNGHRGIWLVSAEGGTPREVVAADVIDYLSWAPDDSRLVYAASGSDRASLWVVDVNTKASTRVPVENARVPAWSPRGEAIAFVSQTGDRPFVHVVSPDGRPVREPLPIDPISLPTALAWSPDGTRLGLVNLPGRAAAEAWVLDIATGGLRKVAELPAPAVFEGLAWTADGGSLVMGRSEYDSEVLLIQLR